MKRSPGRSNLFALAILIAFAAIPTDSSGEIILSNRDSDAYLDADACDNPRVSDGRTDYLPFIVDLGNSVSCEDGTADASVLYTDSLQIFEGSLTGLFAGGSVTGSATHHNSENRWLSTTGLAQAITQVNFQIVGETVPFEFNGQGAATAMGLNGNAEIAVLIHSPSIPDKEWRVFIRGDSTTAPLVWHGEGELPPGYYAISVALRAGGSSGYTNTGTLNTASATGSFTFTLSPASHDVIVNSPGDNGDANPGDGDCDTGGPPVDGRPECTLRAAIMEANATEGDDRITFDIEPISPVLRFISGVREDTPTIRVRNGPYPDITSPVEIDGTTQPGGRVILDGLEAGGEETDALVVRAPGSTIKGLRIVRFSGNGIRISADSTTILDNQIGVDPDGQAPPITFGNDQHGILIDGASHNEIGHSLSPNMIAHSSGSGIRIQGNARSNELRSNSIFDNIGLGIDLAPEGVTANDDGDGDPGPNDLMNFPTIDSLTGSPSNPTVWGTMNATPQSVIHLEFFISDSCDPSGNGEGRNAVASTVVNMQSFKEVTFHTPLTVPLADNYVLTATATDQDGNTSEFSPCWPGKILKILDAKGDSIPDKDFLLYYVRNDAPTMTEVFLDTIRTDQRGRAPLCSKEVEVGDSVKVTRLLKRNPSRRHPNIAGVGSGYSVTLDNAEFDSEWFEIRYDTLDDRRVQEIKLEHTTLSYNLLVSIEWDVDPEYVDSLKSGFRKMANYMYDVSDGQIRFDTIMIVDEKTHWRDADIQVLADNTYEPDATRWAFYVKRTPGIRSSRRWYGNPDYGRNYSVGENPLNPAALFHHRMFAHEFGHFGLGFFNEYQFVGFTGRCSRLQTYYGFMEWTYSCPGASPERQESTTEMSGERQYTIRSCQNTSQYADKGRSCWMAFEVAEERSYDDVWANIIRPDERLKEGIPFFEGPNQTGSPLDYDVGALITFLGTVGSQTANDRPGTARDADGSPLPRAKVSQTIASTGRRVYQGMTSDNGRIVILGYTNGDILAVQGGTVVLDLKRARSKSEGSYWFSGITEVSAGTSGDSIDMILKPVAGCFPLLCNLASNGGSLDLIMTGAREFPQSPTVELYTHADATFSYDFDAGDSIYVATITDELDDGGQFTVWAFDDSSDQFFFSIDYTNRKFDDADTSCQVTSPSGDASFSWDRADGGEARAIVLSTEYPGPRSGLAPESRRAGQIQALFVDPWSAADGEISAKFGYSETYISTGTGTYGNEESIRVFRWDESASQWEFAGGAVDTAYNQVSLVIPSPGVYAAYSTEIDGVAPELTIGVHQNPLLPSYLDIYVIADEPLSGTPLLCANEDTLGVQQVPGESTPMYVAPYQLTGAGTIELRTVAADTAGNTGQAVETFESFPVTESASEWTGDKGRFRLSIPPNAFDETRYVLLFTDEVPDGRLYDLRPHALSLNRKATLRITATSPPGPPGGGYIIERRDNDGDWIPLPTTVDPETGALMAHIDRLASYRVRTGAESSSPTPRAPHLSHNSPNPFNAYTVIEYGIPRSRHVSLEVFNVLGQRIVVLVDGVVNSGYHQAMWNGRDGRGQEVSSGIYFYRLKTGDAVLTRKMLLLK